VGVTGYLNGSPSNGDSTYSQTFTAQAGASWITVYAMPSCRDVVANDWATVTLTDNTAGTTATLLPKTCSNNGVWIPVGGRVVPGHQYTLTLLSHDNNVTGTGSCALWDDISVQ
jgi:hypothetical protein